MWRAGGALLSFFLKKNSTNLAKQNFASRSSTANCGEPTQRPPRGLAQAAQGVRKRGRQRDARHGSLDTRVRVRVAFPYNISALEHVQEVDAGGVFRVRLESLRKDVRRNYGDDVAGAVGAASTCPNRPSAAAVPRKAAEITVGEVLLERLRTIERQCRLAGRCLTVPRGKRTSPSRR